MRGSKDETGQWGMRKGGKEEERRGGDKRKETRGNEVGDIVKFIHMSKTVKKFLKRKKI